MSTKCSINYRDQTDDAPGFHLYEDCLDFEGEGNATPVYLRLDGVHAELSTQTSRATVTVQLPREMAQALGLLPVPKA